MGIEEQIIVSIYFIDIILITYLFVNEKKWSLLSFFLFLGTAIMFASNVPIIFYEHYIGDDDIYFTLPYLSIFKGTIINLVFLIFWQLGFLLGIKMKITESNKFVSERDIKFGLFFLFVSALFYIRHYSQSYSYAYSNDLYEGGASVEASTFGIFGSFKNLFVPIIGGLLLVFYQRKVKGRLPNQTLSKWIVYALWFALFFTVYIGLTKDLQRGDIIKPFVLVALILIVKGISAKKILLSLGFLAVLILFISPFIDILRIRGWYDKEVSISTVTDMLENEKALKYVQLSQDNFFSAKSFLVQIARKNVLPKYSGALAQYANREGYAYFLTYPTIVVDIIPKAIYGTKPYALSSDGTRSSTAMGISATESGNDDSVFWETGGGTLYWQFWWFGVIIGGAFVGFLWAITLKYALYGNSFLFLIMILGTVHWGLTIIAGLDNFFLTIVRAVKPIAIFFIIKLIWTAVFLKKRQYVR